MKPTAFTMMSLLTLSSLLACDTESAELPAAPSANIFSGSEETVNLNRRRQDGDRMRFSDWSAPTNLGATVNSPSTEIEVSISKDGRSLFFASNRSGNFDIWVSQRRTVHEPWGPPQNLGPPVNTPLREQAPFISPDGHKLFFFSDRDGGFGGTDLYISRRRNKHDDFGWDAPVNLGSGVNTAGNESLPVYFENEGTGRATLYFSRTEFGGTGSDIYASTLQRDRTFGPAVLVEELSSPRRDRVLAIRRDGLELFLASDRPGPTQEPFDLWVATRAATSDPWSVPVKLGPVINSAVDEGSAGLSFGATELYFIRSGDLWVSTRSRLTHGRTGPRPNR